MSKLKDSVKEALVEIDHVEETAEGQLKGGFSLVVMSTDDIEPLDTNIIACNDNCKATCVNNCLGGCNGVTTTLAEGPNGLIEIGF